MIEQKNILEKMIKDLSILTLSINILMCFLVLDSARDFVYHCLIYRKSKKRAKKLIKDLKIYEQITMVKYLKLCRSSKLTSKQLNDLKYAIFINNFKY